MCTWLQLKQSAFYCPALVTPKSLLIGDKFALIEIIQIKSLFTVSGSDANSEAVCAPCLSMFLCVTYWFVLLAGRIELTGFYIIANTTLAERYTRLLFLAIKLINNDPVLHGRITTDLLAGFLHMQQLYSWCRLAK